MLSSGPLVMQPRSQGCPNLSENVDGERNKAGVARNPKRSRYRLIWSAKPPDFASARSTTTSGEVVPDKQSSREARRKLPNPFVPKLRFTNRGRLGPLPKQSFDPGRITKRSFVTRDSRSTETCLVFCGAC